MSPSTQLTIGVRAIIFIYDPDLIGYVCVCMLKEKPRTEDISVIDIRISILSYDRLDLHHQFL